MYRLNLESFMMDVSNHLIKGMAQTTKNDVPMAVPITWWYISGPSSNIKALMSYGIMQYTNLALRFCPTPLSFGKEKGQLNY